MIFTRSDYYRQRIPFLLKHLPDNPLEQNLKKLIENNYDENLDVPFVIIQKDIYEKVTKELKDEDSKNKLNLYSEWERIRLAFWIDQFLSYIWYNSKSFLSTSNLLWTYLPAHTKLYTITPIQFTETKIPNRMTNYFTIDSHNPVNFSKEGEFIASYNLDRNPLYKMTSTISLNLATLFINEFQTTRELKLIHLSPLFNTFDALQYFSVDLRTFKEGSSLISYDVQDSDALKNNLCSQAQLPLSDLYSYLYLYVYLYGPKNVPMHLQSNSTLTLLADGIYMFGQNSHESIPEIVLCSKTTIDKILKFNFSENYSTWITKQPVPPPSSP